MGSLVASNLTYAHPGGDPLFTGVSFRLRAGQHAGLVGVNGVGKSTLLACLAGELELEGGDVDLGGRHARMPQDVGVGEDERTVHELLLDLAPVALRRAGRALLEAERDLDAGRDAEAAGMRLGEAIGDWSELGGYELQAQWDAACRRIVGAGFDVVGARRSTQLSGGERKRLVLDLLFGSDAPVLLLDEPDNFLDIPAKRALEQRIRASPKTILLISHDRELLSAAIDSVITLEGRGAWVHPGSYATYPEARDARQQRMGDALQRWNEEERRLRDYVRLLKERARYAPDFAKKADAAETRWKRFADAGPPPAPVVDQAIKVRLRGGHSARRVVDLRALALPGLMKPLTDEVHFGERVGLIGPNGTGKTHLIRLLAGEDVAHTGALVQGPRVSAGLFTQLNVRPDSRGRTVLSIVRDHVGNDQAAMQALARYRLVDAAAQRHETLSGGQKARLEILGLELEGHNLLLLDEPTDNLDPDSAEALEHALDAFEGTVIAVSHDRAFLRRLDRFWMLRAPAEGGSGEGRVSALGDPDAALRALESAG